MLHSQCKHVWIWLFPAVLNLSKDNFGKCFSQNCLKFMCENSYKEVLFSLQTLVLSCSRHTLQSNIVYLPCFLQFDVFFSSFPWPLPLPSSFVGGSSSRTQEQHLQSETHAALFPWQPLHWALLVQTIKQCQLCIHTHSCTHAHTEERPHTATLLRVFRLADFFF